MAGYESDPSAASDAGFVRGALSLLAEGNAARLLDPRRTPLRVLGLDLDTGLMRLRVEAFEDEGAVWELPIERVDRLQFPLGSKRLPEAMADGLAAVAQHFDRVEHRAASDARLTETAGRLSELTLRARALFPRPPHRPTLTDEGTDPEFADLAVRWWQEQGVAELETRFARAWASNPASDETVKAHLLVLAGLGLAAYRGPVLRDPARLSGEESVERRERHILARLAFVRAMLSMSGVESVMLFRGYALTGPWRSGTTASLVSATADRRVAEQHFDADTPAGVLQRASVGADRVFMTWLETPQLSHPYRESEVVLLAPRDDSALF